MRRVSNHKLEGFSLIEIAMVLLVIGIIVGSVFKGKDVIESAQIRSVANDIECLMMAYNNYIGTYSSLPGDDSSATDRFSGIENGDGDGKYSEADAKKVFSHLHAAGLISSPKFKVPKIGGNYTLKADKEKLKLVISCDEKGVMTLKQVRLLQAKMIEIFGESGVNLETTPALSDENKDERYVIMIPVN